MNLHTEQCVNQVGIYVMFFSFIDPTAKVNNVSVENFYNYVIQVFTVQAYFLPAKTAHLQATMTCAYGLREMKIVLGVRRIIEPVCGFRERKTLHRRRYSWYLFLLEVE